MQKNIVKWTVFTIASITCFASMAEPEVRAEDRWLLAKYDVNGDKLISVGEVEDKRKKMFFGMDRDASGGVSFSEYQEVDSIKRAQLLKARFSRLDLNQDGTLTDAEYTSYLGSFERFDKNGDGNISGAEMTRDKAARPEAAAVSQKSEACLLWFCVRKSIR